MSTLRIRRRLRAAWYRFVRRFDRPRGDAYVSIPAARRAGLRVSLDERRTADWPVQQINSGWEYQQQVAARIRRGGSCPVSAMGKD